MTNSHPQSSARPRSKAWPPPPGGVVPMFSDWALAVRDGYRALCPEGEINTVSLSDLADLVDLPEVLVDVVARWDQERGLIGEGLIGVGRL